MRTHRRYFHDAGIRNFGGLAHASARNDVVASTASVVYHMGGFDRRLTKLSGKCQPELFEYTGVINPLT